MRSGTATCPTLARVALRLPRLRTVRPANGHRFNHHKLLLDPYAEMVTGGVRWSDAHFGYRVGAPRADLSFDRRDNAAGMPKCVVVDTAFTWGNDRPLHTRWHDLVFYEMHVRGYTMLHPDVAAGTAAARSPGSRRRRSSSI